MYFIFIQTPLGRISVCEEGGKITRLCLRARQAPAGAEEKTTPLLQEAEKQVNEYFAGKRRTFDLPVRPRGTPFQQEVWRALCLVPYGQTASYGRIAARIGRPKACRAVGMANNKNPVAILIPCHRVIGADGSLTGYAGGLKMKKFLLRLEAKHR